MQNFLSDLNFDRTYAISKSTDQGLIDELKEIGVIERRKTCVKCGSVMSIVRRAALLDGFTWQCKDKKCNSRVSIRDGAWFAKAHIPIGKQLFLLFCYLRYPKMLSADMADIVGLGEHSIVDWQNFIRESVSHYFDDNPIQLGRTAPVQIDESLFGGKCKYHRGDHGRHVQSWVFGMVEEWSGLCVLKMVDDRRRDTLYRHIKSHVLPHATVKTDDASMSRTLEAEGFSHLVVNHSIEFVTSEGVIRN